MDLDNIIKEYGVPMASGVHMEYPQTIRERKRIYRQPFYTVAEPVALGQEQVIEQMSGADGITTASQNTQIIGMENRIKALNDQNTLLDNDNISLKQQLESVRQMASDKYRIWQDCTWKGGSCTYYKCEGKCYNKKEKDKFLQDYYNYDSQANTISNKIKNNDTQITNNKTELATIQTKLDEARKSAAQASMTAAELQAYNVAQRQAEAQAQATVIQAEAIAASTKSKSKIFLIVGIAAGIALIGGLTFYFIKGRKKGIPTPVVKPVAPVIK